MSVFWRYFLAILYKQTSKNGNEFKLKIKDFDPIKDYFGIGINVDWIMW